jgi:hypothetical protein
VKIISATQWGNCVTAFEGATFFLRQTKEGRYFVQKPRRQRSVRVCNTLITSGRSQHVTNAHTNRVHGSVVSDHHLVVDSVAVHREPSSRDNYVLKPEDNTDSVSQSNDDQYSRILWFGEPEVSLRIPSEDLGELEGMRLSPEVVRSAACIRRQVIADDLIVLKPEQAVVACFQPSQGEDTRKPVEQFLSTWMWTGRELYANGKLMLPTECVWR